MKNTPDLRVAPHPTYRYCLSLGAQWYPIQVVGTPGHGRQNQNGKTLQLALHVTCTTKKKKNQY